MRWWRDTLTSDAGCAVATALMSAALMAVPQAAGLPSLSTEVEAGWRAYVAGVEAARQRRDVSPSAFLVLDREGGQDERAAVMKGAVVIRRMTAPPGVGSASLSSAQVHHWRGAVFLPDTTVTRLVAALEQRPPSQPDVLRARVLSRGPSGIHVYLRLRRQQILTVVYDTEHVVRFIHHGPGRASSVSRAVRITEVDAPGSPEERPLGEDDDRDFLWRLNAYWRYQDVPGGVIAECESISLSRDVPFALRMVARPVITRAAESAMGAALMALRGV